MARVILSLWVYIFRRKCLLQCTALVTPPSFPSLCCAAAWHPCCALTLQSSPAGEARVSAAPCDMNTCLSKKADRLVDVLFPKSEASPWQHFLEHSSLWSSPLRDTTQWLISATRQASSPAELTWSCAVGIAPHLLLLSKARAAAAQVRASV